MLQAMWQGRKVAQQQLRVQQLQLQWSKVRMQRRRREQLQRRQLRWEVPLGQMHGRLQGSQATGAQQHRQQQAPREA